MRDEALIVYFFLFIVPICALSALVSSLVIYLLQKRKVSFGGLFIYGWGFSVLAGILNVVYHYGIELNLVWYDIIVNINIFLIPFFGELVYLFKIKTNSHKT